MRNFIVLVRVVSSPEIRHLFLGMLSLLRVSTPVPLKLSPSSHQLTPYSPFGKRATCVVLADASNSPAGRATPSDHPPPLTTCHPKEVELPTVDTQRFPFSSRQLPVCDIGCDTGNNNATNPDTSPNSNTSHSSFPVLGPFDLLHCLQTGGFGDAWAAKDRGTGRVLCLKAFRSLQEPGVTRSVQTELRIFRRMVKSKRGKRGKLFVIELNRSIQHDTAVFFAMLQELMTTDLGMYMSTEPERCKLHARRWMAQIALGIESLHEMGILHRDIKSENILIDSRENAKIIDFGLAYLGPTGQPLRQGAEYAIEFLGTVPYLAPEILRNKGMPTHQRTRYGTAVDWWALGCVLFELESQDHQLLFETEEDVHAYVDWTQRPCQLEQVYSMFDGLDPVVVNLMEGLLQIQPSIRYSLNDLERHDYFLHPDGRSEFDNAAARALERPVRPELVPQFTGDDGPSEVIEAAKLSSIYDWTNLK
ncbi:kinase-like domain-containing protein [Lanmaoa asiatica]|nr:kinase-like domain-containing protein [Lanmaoa asiatica]